MKIRYFSFFYILLLSNILSASNSSNQERYQVLGRISRQSNLQYFIDINQADSEKGITAPLKPIGKLEPIFAQNEDCRLIDPITGDTRIRTSPTRVIFILDEEKTDSTLKNVKTITLAELQQWLNKKNLPRYTYTQDIEACKALLTYWEGGNIMAFKASPDAEKHVGVEGAWIVFSLASN
jgi:hypothetical protein